MPDPKLKEAAAEIKGILMKHDIGGFVAIVSETHSEFVVKFDTSWDAITVTNEEVRIRAKEAELGSKEAVMKKVGLTCHLLCQMRDLSALCFKYADVLINKVETVHEIDHTSFSQFEPHREN